MGAPLGVDAIVAAVGAADTVLDLGCGGGRLTIELARAGARATGIDTHAGRLGQARERAHAAGVDIGLIEADMNAVLPFADGAFAAVTSRLSLMVARDPVATLCEAARVTQPGGGRVVTAVWAQIEENPWFGVPRVAVAAALGAERAAFAGPFGRLGDLDELLALHRNAGLADVSGRVLRDEVVAATPLAHWAQLAATIGHYTRIDAGLSAGERAALDAELARRLEPYRHDGALRLGRAMVLVSARRI